MQQIIDNIKQTPIDLGILKMLVPDKCKAVKYSDLKNKSRRNVFKGVEGLAVLIPHKESPIGHFIVLLPKRHHIEYFSSLGGSFDEELDKLHQSHAIMQKIVRKKLHL